MTEKPFTARFLFPDFPIPGRAYLHRTGFELWRNGAPIPDARDYLNKKLRGMSLRPTEGKFDYLLATMWGMADTGSLMIDFFWF